MTSGHCLFYEICNIYFLANLKSLPGKRADGPRSSSMRINWLYLAILSDLDAEPVLICPVFSATARSAMVVSSVSPERCEITDVMECWVAS